MSQIDAAADTLIKTDRKIRNDNAENAPAFLAVVSGMVNAAYRRKDGVYVMPITALRP